MAPVTSQLGFLALASAVLAVPHLGHDKFHHKSGRPHKSTGGPHGPYGFANGTLAGPTGTGTGHGTGAARTSTQTLTSIVSVVPVASANSVASNENAASVYSGNAYSSSSSSCSDTVYTTYTPTVYVTATAGSSQASAASASSSGYAGIASAASGYAASSGYAAASGYVAPSGYAAASGYAAPSGHAASSVYVASSSVSSSSEAPVAFTSASAYSAAASSSSQAAYSASAYSSSSSSVASSSSLSSTSSAASATSTAASGLKTKRGCAYNNGDSCAAFSSDNVAWAYNWVGYNGSLPEGYTFIPTLHSSDWTFTEYWSTFADEAIAAGAPAIFTFNEPDMTVANGGSGLSVSNATGTFATELSQFYGKVQIGSPSVSNSDSPGEGLNWLQEFSQDTSVWDQVDFVNIHWYTPYNTSETDMSVYVDEFEQHVQNAYSLFGKPVWITEFGLNDEAGDPASADLVESFLELAIPWLEASNQSYVHAYSYFFNPTTGSPLMDGTTLTAAGSCYETKA